MTEKEIYSFKQWLKGIPYEIAFWKSYYGHADSLRDLDSWSEYGKECHLDNFDIKKFVESCPSIPRFVDLGCALSYTFGTKLDGIDIEIDRVDPLASFYNQILQKYAPNRPKIKYGMIECISACYEKNSVDLIHVRNALDHCSDPILGIMECLECLRIEGVLYLNHHRNEALREGYRGFHQYNIDIEDGKLIIWKKDARIDLNAFLADFSTVECSVTDREEIVAVITKKSELIEYNARKSKERAMKMLNLALQSFNSSSFSMRYHLDGIVANIAHKTMRRIPRKLVERIKKSLSKSK